MLIIVAVAACLYFATIGVLSALIALGQSHWIGRLVMLFAVSIISAFFVELLSLRGEILIGALVGGSCLAYFLAYPTHVTAIPTGAVGALFLLGTAAMVPWSGIDFDGVARGICVIGSTSGVLLVMRVMGFRIVRMIPSGWSNEIFLGTGREIDEWCHWLDEHQCQAVGRPELARRLREEGIEFTWSDTIISIYRGYLTGAAPEWTSAVDHEQHAEGQLARSASDRGRRSMQFSLSQMFAWVTVCAFVVASLRAFSQEFPTQNDLVFGPPIVLILSLCVIASMIGVLSLPRSGNRLLGCLVILAVAAIVTPGYLQLQGFVAGRVLPVAGIVVFVLIISTTFGFTILRSLGYRLLRSGDAQSTSSIMFSIKTARIELGS